MSRPLRIDYPNAYYHVTCRGNERRAIFKDNQDRSVFLERLRSSLAIYGVRLHCYVLMDNHFHLVVGSKRGQIRSWLFLVASGKSRFRRRTGKEDADLF